MRRITPLLGTLALLAGACAEPEHPMTRANEIPALDGTSWTLTDLVGHTAPAGVAATIQFDGDQLSGSDGCNRYRGGYELDETGFRVGAGLASTQMACPEPVMSFARAFTVALTSTRSARVDGSGLTLSDASGATLVTFEATSQSLAGTTWNVSRVNNGTGGVTGVLAGTTLSMTFGADGALGGSGGCNTYTTSFTQTGRDIELGGIAVTRKMCSEPEGVMKQEMAFMKALEASQAVRVEGDSLELRTAEGALQVGATRARD